MERWTFLTNYGHVFLCIAADPSIRLIDVAGQVGITERSAQRIVADLIDEGYLTHSKVGRRNQYQVRPDLPMRHPVERENAVGELLKLLRRKPVLPLKAVSSTRSKKPEIAVQGRKQTKEPDRRASQAAPKRSGREI